MLTVARDCIGKILVSRTAEGITAGRIVECEAYRGPADLAAHSAGGRRTKRTEVMFGPPGHAYLFLLYGMHWAFNLVAGKEGEPHAVLVRAIEPVRGAELMCRRRGIALPTGTAPPPRNLTNGPGKVCAALGLTGDAYGRDLCGDVLYLQPASPGRGASRAGVGRSPRINVDYAGVWAERPWRFYERGNRWVSVAPRN